LPKWADPEKLTFLQAVKIINYRMRNKNSDNMKPGDLNIDTLIQERKEKQIIYYSMGYKNKSNKL
jgi:hypothetical protein